MPAVSAAVRDERGRVHVLTITLTAGVAVSYSPAPVLADDGSASRRYFRLPLTDGVGAALVTADPDRVRMRVDSAGSTAIVPPLVVAPPDQLPGTVAALPVPITRPASCASSPQAADVPRMVHEATRDAGLSGSDLTSVRLLWCRHDSIAGEAALALTARSGPDIQCYELGEEASDGLRSTAWQCWPVPRGTGSTAPFLAPDTALGSSPADVLALTAFAPGASTADVSAGPLGSLPPGAREGGRRRLRAVSPYPSPPARSRAFSSARVSSSSATREARRRTVLAVRSRQPSDVWGEGADGPRPRLARVTTKKDPPAAPTPSAPARTSSPAAAK